MYIRYLLLLISCQLFVISETNDSQITNGNEGIECHTHSDVEKCRPSKVNSIPRKNYILILGLSGCGKSSMVNALFSTNAAPIGDTESTTSEIYEYSIRPNVNPLAHHSTSSSELIVIDTPGLDDTGGIEKDAQFLATLDNYLQNHEELSVRAPDMVLICSRFDDNRFSGEGSKFVKMLRGISSVASRIFSLNQCNILFVLTHVTGVLPNEAKHPESKIRNITQAILDYTSFPPPILTVLAENKGDEELKSVQGGYELPNGEIYPKNLCDKIVSMTNNTCSTSGTMSALTYCCQELNYSLNVSLQQSISLMNETDAKTKKMLELLISSNFKYVETEVSLALANAFRKIESSETQMGLSSAALLDSLNFVQRSFYLKGIKRLKDIPRIDSEVAKLYRSFQQDTGIHKLLEYAFGLEAPIINFDLIVGNFYDTAVTDTVMPNSPFSRGEYKNSILGYKVPSFLICSSEDYTKFIYRFFDNEENYFQFRSSRSGDSIFQPKDSNVLNMRKRKPGFNIKSIDTGVYSAAMEYRLFSVELDPTLLTFDSSFLRTLRLLGEFNVDDPDSVHTWSQFLTIVGTDVISKAFVGGSLEIQFQLDQTENADFADVNDLIQYLHVNSDNRSIKIKTLGGDNTFKSQDFQIFFPANSSSTYLHMWLNSLIKFPAILTTELEFTSVNELLKLKQLESAAQIENALEYFSKNSECKAVENRCTEKTQGVESSLNTCTTQNGNLLSQLTELSNQLNAARYKNSELSTAASQCTLEKGSLTQELSRNKASVSEKEAEIVRQQNSIRNMNTEFQAERTRENNSRRELLEKIRALQTENLSLITVAAANVQVINSLKEEFGRRRHWHHLRGRRHH